MSAVEGDFLGGRALQKDPYGTLLPTILRALMVLHNLAMLIISTYHDHHDHHSLGKLIFYHCRYFSHTICRQPTGRRAKLQSGQQQEMTQQKMTEQSYGYILCGKQLNKLAGNPLSLPRLLILQPQWHIDLILSIFAWTSTVRSNHPSGRLLSFRTRYACQYCALRASIFRSHR